MHVHANTHREHYKPTEPFTTPTVYMYIVWISGSHLGSSSNSHQLNMCFKMYLDRKCCGVSQGRVGTVSVSATIRVPASELLVSISISISICVISKCTSVLVSGFATRWIHTGRVRGTTSQSGRSSSPLTQHSCAVTDVSTIWSRQVPASGRVHIGCVRLGSHWGRRASGWVHTG